MKRGVVLVGCGNMGRAMLTGWLDSGKLAAGQVEVVEPSAELRQRVAALGVAAHETSDELTGDGPKLVILAVKPQVIAKVATEYKALVDNGSAFVSIAAGTPISTLADVLGPEVPIIRCMPNTPAAVGKGMMVVFANPKVSDSLLSETKDLLSANGMVETIDDEELMHAVTALSGSGPAYLFHFIECMAAAGIAAGLPEATAQKLAMQTAYGAGALAAASPDTPTTLREQVTSPNGTTAAALSVLMGEKRMETLLTEAVEAARARSMELGK